MPYFLSLFGALMWSAALLWVILYLSAKYDENHNFFKLLAIVAAPILLPSGLLWLRIAHVAPAMTMALSILATIPLFLWLIHKYCRLSWRRAIISTTIFFVGTAILNVALDAVREHAYPQASYISETPPPSKSAISAQQMRKPPEVAQARRKLLPEERILVEVMKWRFQRFMLSEQLAALRETLKAFPSVEISGIDVSSVRRDASEYFNMRIRGRMPVAAAETVERLRIRLSGAPDIAAAADKVVAQPLSVEQAQPLDKDRIFQMDCVYKSHYLPAAAAVAVTGPLSVEEVVQGLKSAMEFVVRPANGNYPVADTAKGCAHGMPINLLKESGVVSMAPAGGKCNVDAFALRVSAQATDAQLESFIRALESSNPMVYVSALSVQITPGAETRDVALTIEWPVWSSQLEANRLMERAEKLSKELQGKKRN
jgi:hypothetical protein